MNELIRQALAEDIAEKTMRNAELRAALSQLSAELDHARARVAELEAEAGRTEEVEKGGEE